MMNFAQIGVLMGGNIYDPSYQSVLARAISLGYTLPSDAQKVKQNQLIINLKAANIWDSLDILYVFATNGSSDFATINWKAPSSYQITKVNSPTHTSNVGYVFNGTTQYLNTGWIPSTNGVNFTLNESGGFVNEQVNLGVNTTAIFGAANSGVVNRILLNPRNASNTSSYSVNDNTGSVPANANSVGFYHILRTAASGAGSKQLYKDGVSLSSLDLASTGLASVAVYIGAYNLQGTGASQYRASTVGVFGAGASLTGKESSLYTAWNTYFTSL